MTAKEQAYKHGREDAQRLTREEEPQVMDKKKAKWWVEMLFTLKEFEEAVADNTDRAAEIREARKYVVECIEKVGDEG